MKKITLEQLLPIVDILNDKQRIFKDENCTFKPIYPWDVFAWEVSGLVQEQAMFGDGLGFPIAVEHRCVCEESDIDYIKRNVTVYRQFKFPNQDTGEVSVNLREWLNLYHLNAIPPSVHLVGETLEIDEIVLPVDTFVVINTFLVERITKEITLTEYLKESLISSGDVVRCVKIEEDEVKKHCPSFMIQKFDFDNKSIYYKVK